MKLTDSQKGATYRVVSLSLPKDACRRFEVLGMTVGSNIGVVNVSLSGARIIKIRGTRFAIGRDFCDRIEVADI